MTLRRASLGGKHSSPLKSPRRTAQSLHRRALLQKARQLAKPAVASAASSSAVSFGAASKANLKVVVRVRPFNTRETETNARKVIDIVDEHMLVFDPKQEQDVFFYHGTKQRRDITKRQHKDQKFVFERVFGPDSTNQDVFQSTTKDIIETLLSGYNCSVFAYGATGAGKTFTMVGRPECPGITLLTLMELYERIDSMEAETTVEVAVSYLEVYNEMVRDLLQPGKPLQVQDSGQQVLVPGLSFHKPRDTDHLMSLLALGNSNRSQHPTDANAESSRSHAVFQVIVKQHGCSAGTKNNMSIAKLSMIDLAGSERASSTGCTGVRFREGANINRSLLALGNCINALADGKSHIPYRDSKLTRLLKDSLGGNCRSVMVAAVSMASTTFEDTFNTLRYSNRAKTIKTTLKKNQISVENHVSQYVKIVEALKQEVVQLKGRLEESEQREQQQAEQATQYEETIADLRRQLKESRESAAYSSSSSSNFNNSVEDNTADGSALATPLSADSSSDTSCRSPLGGGSAAPVLLPSPPVEAPSEEAEAALEELRAAVAQVAGLHRESLELASYERELELKLHIARLKSFRLNIIAFASYKLNKSVSKLERSDSSLQERLLQTRSRRAAVDTRLASARQRYQQLRQHSGDTQAVIDLVLRADAEDVCRLQQQECSSLRALFTECAGELQDGHGLQCVLLQAVRSMHVQLHSTQGHTDTTQGLLQSVFTNLDEFRIAWADQLQPAGDTADGTSSSSSGSEAGTKSNGTTQPQQLPQLDVGWLTRLNDNSQQSPLPRQPVLLNTVRKSIMKGSSSSVNLDACSTSPLEVHSIAQSAEQLRQSTLINTINNKRLALSSHTPHPSGATLLPPVTTLAQLVSAPGISFMPPQAATVAMATSSTVTTTSSLTNSFLENFDENVSPVLETRPPRYAPATPMHAKYPPATLEETSPPAVPVLTYPGVSVPSTTSHRSLGRLADSTFTMEPDASPPSPVTSQPIINNRNNPSNKKATGLQRHNATKNLMSTAAPGAVDTSVKSINTTMPGFVSMLSDVPLPPPSTTIEGVAGSRRGIYATEDFSLTPQPKSSSGFFVFDPALASNNPADFNLTSDAASTGTNLNTTVDLPSSMGFACLNTTIELPASRSAPASALKSTGPSDAAAGSNSAVHCSPSHDNASCQPQAAAAELNSTYTAGGGDDDADSSSSSDNAAAADHQQRHHAARQLQFNSPQPPPQLALQNSTFCVEPPSDGTSNNAPPGGLPFGDPMSLLHAVTSPPARAAPKTQPLKPKSILKNSGASSSVLQASTELCSSAANSRRGAAAAAAAVSSSVAGGRALGRSQSVRNLPSSAATLRRNINGNGFSKTGAPLPDKSSVMRRVMSFKARRLHAAGGTTFTTSNQENIPPPHLSRPASAAQLAAAAKLASLSCVNLSSSAAGRGGIHATSSSRPLSSAASVSNLTSLTGRGLSSTSSVTSMATTPGGQGTSRTAGVSSGGYSTAGNRPPQPPATSWRP